MLIIDPPEGWRYGFPKPLTKKLDQSLRDWLLEQKYPEHLLDVAIKYSRYWEEKDE